MNKQSFVIMAILGLAAFTVAGFGNIVEVQGDIGAKVGGSVNTPGVDVPDVRVCSQTTGCNQVDTPDVEEEEIEEEITIDIGDLDGQ